MISSSILTQSILKNFSRIALLSYSGNLRTSAAHYFTRREFSNDRPSGGTDPTNGKKDTDEPRTESTKNIFSAEPVKMVRAHLDRDKRSHRVGVGEVAEGTAGEKIFEFIDPKSVTYPTIETLKEPFGGIPYRELPEVRIYLSKNNTKVAVVDYQGNFLFGTSAGTEGFKNCKKKTEVAGQTVGVSAGNKCLRRGLKHVRVALCGIGPGRQSCVLGMSMAGVRIVSLSDISLLPEMGPRPRKARRL